ncbi:MAG: TlpA family protein disulfide reductase [Candidatus Obscuribacterales bacterium]|nr:TlpA family protein disulfide reductase [Candidatus Obscuribacterales bacterium]
MVALIEGTRAPEIHLRDLQGDDHSVHAAVNGKKHAVVAFFKEGCPVCQLTAPFLERLHLKHPELPIFGVSQDDSESTREFVSMYGLSFPVLLDEALQSTVDYDLSNVPSIFLIGQDLTIEQTIVGFVKDDLESLHTIVGSETGTALFTDADEVPAFRPG